MGTSTTPRPAPAMPKDKPCAASGPFTRRYPLLATSDASGAMRFIPGTPSVGPRPKARAMGRLMPRLQAFDGAPKGELVWLRIS